MQNARLLFLNVHGIWRRGLELGITTDIGFTQKRAIRNLNALAMIYMPVPMLLSIVIVLLSDAFVWPPVIGGFMVSVSLVFLLISNHLRWYRLGKAVHYFLTLTGLLLNVYCYGAGFGIDFFILIMFIGAFTFSHEPTETLILSVLAILAYGCALYFEHYTKPLLDAPNKFVLHLLFSMITFMIINSSLRLLQTENELYNKAVEENNQLLLFQKEEFMAQHENVKQLLQELSHKNSVIRSSLDYAKRLQEAVMPPITGLKQIFPDAFVYFKPKDTVSGDFYWHFSFNDRVYFTVADCTGHGISGALMSMLGSSILHQIVQSTLADSPKLILKYLNIHLQQVLQSSGRNAHDGIDLALCIYDPKTSVIKISSTNRPYIVIRQGQLMEFRGSRSLVGSNLGIDRREFEDHELELQKEDVLYFFTDGVTDQFDQADQKKFSLKRLREFLALNHKLKMEDQGRLLAEKLQEWKGTNSQTDDMLLIGLRI
jgi:serine phosphatase RsbU (regulator of sigma subunit)